MPTYEWRVTKYDPQIRDKDGRFDQHAWTSVSDVGVNSTSALGADEYLQIEDAYSRAARAFAIESGELVLEVLDLEFQEINQGSLAVKGVSPIELPKNMTTGSKLTVSELDSTVRAALRELIWCRLESGNFFIHFGRDFYMYVGSDLSCPSARLSAHASGLFVENAISPFSSSWP